MKIPGKGSTVRQLAYARRVWGADGVDKQQIALDVGYPPNVARSVVSKIESKKGFQNAIAQLAKESNNLALEVMSELKARGTRDFSNADLVKALSAIAKAWDTFNKPLLQRMSPEDNGKNRLRTVILQSIEKQVNVTDQKSTEVITPDHNAVEGEYVIKGEEDINNLDL